MAEQVATQTGAENVHWDLSDLFSGVDDPAIEQTLDGADQHAAKLSAEYRGRVADLDAEEMRDLIEQYEDILDGLFRVGGYAYLHWSVNTEDAARGALFQMVRERGSRLEQELLFIPLEWAKAPEDKAQALMADEVVAAYRHWLEVSRMREPYLLTEPEERILSEKRVTGKDAWFRFFDELHSAYRYDFDGEELPQSRVLTYLFNPDQDVRKRAAESVTEGLTELSRMNTYIFNTILADKASDDRLRGYPTWVSSRNLENEVDDETVDAMVQAITSRYDIVSRYYHLKRKLLELDELYEWDRYAPLPAADSDYSWDEARTIVDEAFTAFDPRLASIAGEFFEKGWIDAAVTPGKLGGAYCHSVAVSAHPYVFMNFEGKSRDVMTLAHELGHGIHGYLSRAQTTLQFDTPLTTAETASVFGEMLVFQDMMAREEDPAVRLAMLTNKLEDSFATVFRQVSMNRFENAMHTARREEGELTTERYNELWLETQREMFGDSLTITDDYGLWWSYIPHFVDRPGYVYAYSFGELLVLALYAAYQESGEGFSTRYMDMLSAGGSDWPHEIVKPLGIDLTDPGFWSKGLDILDGMVNEATALAEQIGAA